MSAQPAPGLTFIKPLNDTQIKRRAAYARLMGSLEVPQNTRLLHDVSSKARPATGVFATV